MKNFRDTLGGLFETYKEHLRDKQNGFIQQKLANEINELSDYMTSLEKGKDIYEMVYKIYDEIVKKHIAGDRK